MTTKPLPATDMIDRELVELALESHARAMMYPQSKVQHDRANECRDELLARLAERRVTSSHGEAEGLAPAPTLQKIDEILECQSAMCTHCIDVLIEAKELLDARTTVPAETYAASFFNVGNCYHSVMKPDCASCLQGHATRMERAVKESQSVPTEREKAAEICAERGT